MNNVDLIEAIRHLKPTSQFSFQNNDYSTIKWDVLEGDAPTWAEIEATHKEIQETEAQRKAEAAAKKAAAEAKLAALGLTADDLRALGL